MKHQTRRPAGTAARRTARGLTALLAALVSVAGCASMYPRLETPRLSLVSVEMAEATLFEQRLVVRLRVQNPNSIALPVQIGRAHV